MHTQNDDQITLLRDQWESVFLLAGEIYLFGAIIYAILGDASKQSWADGTVKKVRTSVVLTTSCNDGDNVKSSYN